MTLVAVSKTRPPEAIREAFAAGARDFGENYVQEALPKIAALSDLAITWHFIGGIQGNKARDIAEHFDWVHGLDRAKHAAALSRSRPAGRGPLDVCIQVNISAEATKGGVGASEVSALAREVAALPGLRLRGLMGMASPTADEAKVRAEFALLRGALEGLRREGFAVDTLSMGMTHDLEWAIAEGATMVRVGTAIFGEREARPSPQPSPKGEGATPQPSPTGEGATPQPSPKGEGATPQPSPTGEGATPQPSPTGEGATGIPLSLGRGSGRG